MLEINSAEEFMNLIDEVPLLVQLTTQLAETLENERGVGESRFHEDRKFARHRCSLHGILECDANINPLLSNKKTSKVIIRDLSRNGFGVIAPEQWYPSQLVKLSLPIGQSICEVTRVRYHGNECFEVGLLVRKLIKYPQAEEET